MYSEPSEPAPPFLVRWRSRAGLWALLAGCTLAVGVAAVLLPALHANRAQSFDVMLYTRALWGVAHFDAGNPVVGVSSFAVHLHAGLVLLAPLARVFDPLTALVLGQSVALGATTALVVREGLEALRVDRATPVVAVGLGALVWASCWVSNAFLYDVRPDLLAVPFATAALLRLRRLRRVDRWGLLCGLAAVLCREEMAMTLVAGVVVAPGLRADARARAASAGALGGLWVLYLVAGRAWLGGDEAVERLDGTVGTFLGVEPAVWARTFRDLLPNRLALVLGAACTLGGAAWAGGRWWLAAAPAMAWVLVSLRQPQEALHYHYPLFAAPALLTGAIAGLAWLRAAWEGEAGRSGRRRAGLVVLAVAAVVVSLAFAREWSSWPGGGRFAETRYRAASGPAGPAVVRSHALLDALVEPAEGAVLPWSLVAGRAGRPLVWSQLRLGEVLERGGDLPADLHVVALIRSDAVAFDAALRQRGFLPIVPPSEPLTIYRRARAR